MSKPKRLTMADQLRNAIQDHGKAVSAIAVESGIPQPVLHRFVKGERDLTLTTAEKLVWYFDMELRENG
jgi:plasmid maintenance system antidote protein VapI